MPAALVTTHALSAFARPPAARAKPRARSPAARSPAARRTAKPKLRKLDPKLLRAAKAQDLRPPHVRRAVLDKGLPESQLRIKRLHKFKPGAFKGKPTLESRSTNARTIS